MPRFPRAAILALATAVPLAGLAACGGSDGGPPQATTTAVPDAGDSADRVEVVDAGTYGVEVRTGEVYGTGATASGSVDLLADVYEPTGTDGLRPVAVVVHGGGFTTGARDTDQWDEIGRDLASRGIVAISIDYRLRDDAPIASDRVAPWMEASGGDEASRLAVAIVAAADDLLTALDWVTSDAEALEVDPTRLALVGGSAGAITAMNVAYAADQAGIDRQPVAAVVSFWGALGLAEPADAIGPGEPPVLLFHGTADETVPFARSEAVATATTDAGIDTVFVALEGAGHGFADKDLTEPVGGAGRSILDEVGAFLAIHLE